MGGETLKAIWAYAGQEENELRFEVGQVFKLVVKHNDDWWEGSLDGKNGLFPSNHVEIIAGQCGFFSHEVHSSWLTSI